MDMMKSAGCLLLQIILQMKYGCLELSYSEVEQARCLSGEKMLQEKAFNILLFNMSVRETICH